MRAGLALLCLAYVLSQFFRAFLAVLSGPLERDLGTTPDDLAFASGLWFLVFAAMQIPVGWALDRIGPRRTAAGRFRARIPRRWIGPRPMLPDILPRMWSHPVWQIAA